MEAQKSSSVGELGCKRELGPCERRAHPDSHPVRGDVAGPGGGSEEAYFGWGLRGTFPGLQLIPGETVPTTMEMSSEDSKVLNCLFTPKCGRITFYCDPVHT